LGSDRILVPKKIGVYEYLTLPKEEQWNALWDSGKFLTHRIDGDSKFTLYALDRFFVEVELDKSDKIVGKIEFKYGHNLDNYSPEIQIPE